LKHADGRTVTTSPFMRYSLPEKNALCFGLKFSVSREWNGLSFLIASCHKIGSGL